MAIPIITRTNTIDEWRIQTNQEATALNNLETGDYTKSNGVLTLSGNSSLVITANGTALQVSNNALFQSDVIISKDVEIGVQTSATGNVTIGGITTIRGPGSALQVANNALVNTDLQVTRTIYTGNVSANGNVTVAGNTTVGKTLRLTGTGQVLNVYTGTAFINTATFINTTTTNSAIANAVIDLVTIAVAQVAYSNTVNANIANVNITTANIATGNITTAVITTGNVLTLNTNQTYANTINVIGVSISSNAYINKLAVTTTANVTQDLGVTANIYGGNITTTGTSRTGSFVVTNSANIGGSAFVTGNVQGSNLVISGHSQTATLRTSDIANVGSGLTVTGDEVVGGKIDVTSNVNAGALVITGHSQTATLRTSGVANVGSGLTVTGNVIVSNVVASGLIYTNTLASSGLATLGSASVTGAITVGTTLTVTGNTTSGNLNTTGLVNTGTLRTTGRTDIGGILIAGPTTLSSAYIDGNMTVNGNFILTGSTVIDTNILILRANTPQTIGVGYDYFGVNRGEAQSAANANAHIRWNEPNEYWDIRDVDNPTSYSKILTANLITNSTSTTSSDLLASATSVKTTYDAIGTANTNLKSYTDFRLTSTNAYVSQANTDLKTYTDSNFTLRAASANSYATTTVSNANTSLKAYVDGTVTTNYTSAISAANTNLKNYSDGTFFAKTGGTITGNAIISGNLIVSGDITFINTNELNVGDAIITLNADLPIFTSPSENAGVEINRGSSANTRLLWNESIDKWTFTNDGVNYSQIASAQAEAVANGALLHATSGYNQANTATTNAATADQRSVTSGSYANSAFDKANTGVINAVAAGSYANSAYVQANTANQRAVTSGDYANSAFVQANTGTTNSATADQRAVTSGVYANSAYVQANTATQYAQSAGSYANSAFVQANTANQRAVTSGDYANSAFSVANNKVASIGTTSPIDSTGGLNPNISMLSATSVRNGYMTSTYASKLDGISTGATNVTNTNQLTNGAGYTNVTNTNQLTNGAGYITSAGSCAYATNAGTSTNLSGGTVSATTITATGDITAYFSDERLKTKLGTIENALDKLMSLSGFYYEANETAQALGYEIKREVGVSAQEVQRVMPEVVAPAPIDNQYLTVKYEKLVPLLIEAIKELKAEIDNLKLPK